MKKVIAPAVKTKAGTVVKARAREHHKDIPATGQRGFVLSDGEFVGREKAAKVATKAGQAKVSKLHSSNLKGR